MSVSGRPFLQIPGPTNVPDRILRAMDRPVIDHRSPEFAGLTKEVLPPLRKVFGTREGVVVLYPSSGTGAWEASLRWGQELPAAEVERRLREDREDKLYAAVLVVHNETSTGVTSDIGAIRAAMDAAGHEALLIVDTVSSLASVEFRFDEWRGGGAVAGSPKGLGLPPWPAVVSCRA